MSDLTFETAQEKIKNLSARPSNDTLLELYSLYKQGSSGDATGKRPGRLSPVKRAKWDAWDARKGTSQDDAKASYINLVERLLSEDG